MGRRLPDRIVQGDQETDEEFAERELFSKRRLQTFKRIYREYYAWGAARETGEVSDVLTIEGEDYYYGDLLVGLSTLPDQQRKAFELICLCGHTEEATREIILPDSKWSTPVQQYSDDGLKKMVAAYYAKQAGTWDPAAVLSKQRAKKPEAVSVAEKKIDAKKAHRWDWDSWSDDHTALAGYINEITGLGITPAQVKAVSFLRKEWWHSDQQVAERRRRAEAREAEKAKFAYETPDQKAKRIEANRVLKTQQRVLARAEELKAEIARLREEAGLDPETGEPLVTSAA